MISEIKSAQPFTVTPVKQDNSSAKSTDAPKTEGLRPQVANAMSVDYSNQLLLEKQFGVKLDDVRNKVIDIFRKQGIDTTAIEKMTPQEAQAQISDNGYWGVEKTSERIFNFAVDAAGGDPAKLERIKAAIQHGFDSAKQDFGGTLPDISQKTFDRTMERLDNWAETMGNSSAPQQAKSGVNVTA